MSADFTQDLFNEDVERATQASTQNKPLRPIVILNGEWVNLRWMKLEVQSEPPTPFEVLFRNNFQMEGVRVAAQVTIERSDGATFRFQPSRMEMTARESGRMLLRFSNTRPLEFAPNIEAAVEAAFGGIVSGLLSGGLSEAELEQLTELEEDD